MDQKILPPLKILLITAISFVIILTAFLVGFSCGSKEKVIIPAKTGKPTQNTFEAGWQAAKEKLEQSGILPPEPTEIFTVSGTITKISENTIFLKADPVVLNPLAEPAPENRVITVTQQTKFVKQTPKTPEEITKESENFRKALAALEPGATPPTPPIPYNEEEIELTDIKAGDTISVTSDQNIKMTTTFEAKEIRVTFTPTPLTPLPLP